MKYLNGATVMRGDSVVTVAPDGTPVVGTVHELYERGETIRISGYPLRVPAADTVLAKDAYDAFLEARKPKENPPTENPA